MSVYITTKRAAQIAAKKLPRLSEKRIEANLEAAQFTPAEAYLAGVEEAQEAIVKRFDALAADPIAALSQQEPSK